MFIFAEERVTANYAGRRAMTKIKYARRSAGANFIILRRPFVLFEMVEMTSKWIAIYFGNLYRWRWLFLRAFVSPKLDIFFFAHPMGRYLSRVWSNEQINVKEFFYPFLNEQRKAVYAGQLARKLKTS